MRMGLREANQHFSKAIKAVKAGGEVVLTERGAPIAVIRPLRRRARPDDGLRALEVSGRLRRATRQGPMPAFKPVRIKGEPLSDTVRKGREPRS